MKKLWSLAASTAFVGAGLFAIAPPASAAPYPGTVPTVCKAGALNKPRIPHTARAYLNVGTHGNGAARGAAVFSYVRNKDNTIYSVYHYSYFGPGRNKYAFPTRKLLPGRYTVHVRFTPKPSDSVYKPCRATYEQKIRRPR